MRLPLRLCLLLLGGAVAAGTVRADNAVGRARTIEYLQKLQTSSGGFLPEAATDNKRPSPTLRATSAAVRALEHLGGAVPNRDSAVKFVESCHDAATGGFADTPKGKPDVVATCIGLMTVPALRLAADKYVPAGLKYLDEQAKSFEEVRLAAAAQEAVKRRSPKTDAWLQQVQATANFDGSFGADAGRARATGGAIAAILRLGGSVKDLTVVLTGIKEGQRDSGGWGTADVDDGADLESTYRVMRALYMLKRPPSSLEGVRTFIAKCRNDDGGYGVAPGRPSSVAGTYYAATVQHWVEEMDRLPPP